MSWTYGDYDWDNPIFMAQRDKLADLISELDEYFDEVRQDDHEGSCWDLINGLAMLLTSKERTKPSGEEK
jgi:hypothetical protein